MMSESIIVGLLTVALHSFHKLGTEETRTRTGPDMLYITDGTVIHTVQYSTQLYQSQWNFNLSDIQ